jgi:signal peptidase II
MKRTLLLLTLFIGIILVDQVTKWWALDHRLFWGVMRAEYPYGGLAVFHDLLGVDFSINYVTNEGAAWGVFSHFRWALFAIRCLLVLFLTFFLFFINRDRALQYPLVLILGGAIGNMIDVLLHGHVIDMFKFVLWGYHYPVFNVADASVCIGVCFWIGFSLFSRPPKVMENAADQ